MITMMKERHQQPGQIASFVCWSPSNPPFTSTKKGVATSLSKPLATQKPKKINEFHGNVACYAYRYYDPVTGRWPSRDPIGERGGVNLYEFVGNAGISKVDYLGYFSIDLFKESKYTNNDNDYLYANIEVKGECENYTDYCAGELNVYVTVVLTVDPWTGGHVGGTNPLDEIAYDVINGIAPYQIFIQPSGHPNQVAEHAAPQKDIWHYFFIRFRSMKVATIPCEGGSENGSVDISVKNGSRISVNERINWNVEVGCCGDVKAMSVIGENGSSIGDASFKMNKPMLNNIVR